MKCPPTQTCLNTEPSPLGDVQSRFLRASAHNIVTYPVSVCVSGLKTAYLVGTADAPSGVAHTCFLAIRNAGQPLRIVLKGAVLNREITDESVNVGK